MNLHEQIRNDLKESMKAKDQGKVDALRVIIGEFPRLNLKSGETPNDEQVTAILRRLQKSEKQVLEISFPYTNIKVSTFLDVVESYLPQLMSEEEIISFINSNVNIGEFKNIMQAMGPIMKELKGKADGNDVKAVLMRIK